MGKRNADAAGGFAAEHTVTNTPLPKRIKFEENVADESLEEKDGDEQEFGLRRDLVDGAILIDLAQKHWRVGKPIGKGSFGEIFLASADCARPVTSENAPFVVKIEPHSNGPLFVEIHCLLNAGKPVSPDQPLPPGMPAYIASGSHFFNSTRYRFLILRRFQCDLAALVEQRQLDATALLCVAVQIVDVLEHLHDRGYAHSDIKAENLMLGSCTYERHRPPVNVALVNRVEKDLRAYMERSANGTATTACGKVKTKEDNSKRKQKSVEAINAPNDDEYDDCNGQSEDDEESSGYQTPPSFKRRCASGKRTATLYSGSNPMRACRSTATTSSTTYQDLLISHYLRPTRKINYGLSDDDDESDVKTTDVKKDKDFVCPSWRLGSTENLPRVTRTPADHNGRGSSRRSSSSSNTVAAAAPASAHHGRSSGGSNWVTEDRIHLIDFGLAIKFIDSSGQHRPFCMDARRAHDGTLEFTSRDAHLGAHSRRSDLECFGYNLLYWTEGWLPWKEGARVTLQPEQVHRMKEFFMTDVTVMFQHVYGRPVPRWIGQFMRYVNQLSYQERPDYDLCRNMFYAELQRLNVNLRDERAMTLRTDELLARPVQKRSPPAAMAAAAAALAGGMTTDDENVPAVAVHKSMMRLGLLMSPVLPFREVTAGQNRISPKNLRSKSEKVTTTDKRRKQKSVFSWTEILSIDPDQISRQRAEKEFDREPMETPLVRRYEGKPTYAILDIQSRLKFKDKLELRDETPAQSNHKPVEQQSAARKDAAAPAISYDGLSTKSLSMDSPERRKPGLRTAVRHTPKSLAYRNSMLNKRVKRNAKRPLAVPHSEFSTSADEESSSCSTSTSLSTKSGTRDSVAGAAVPTKQGKRSSVTTAAASSSTASSLAGSAAAESSHGRASGRRAMRQYDSSSCGVSSPVSDDVHEDDDEEVEEEEHVEEEDREEGHAIDESQHTRDGHDAGDTDDESSRDTIDYSPIKTRRRRKANPTTAVGPARISTSSVSVVQRKAAMKAAQQMTAKARRSSKKRLQQQHLKKVEALNDQRLLTSG